MAKKSKDEKIILVLKIIIAIQVLLMIGMILRSIFSPECNRYHNNIEKGIMERRIY